MERGNERGASRSEQPGRQARPTPTDHTMRAEEEGRRRRREQAQNRDETRVTTYNGSRAAPHRWPSRSSLFSIESSFEKSIWAIVAHSFVMDSIFCPTTTLLIARSVGRVAGSHQRTCDCRNHISGCLFDVARREKKVTNCQFVSQ